jgi:hypothetical protein
MEGDLVWYQQMQLAIDLLLHILQSFQLRPFAQTIGLLEGNHAKKHITAWCGGALLQSEHFALKVLGGPGT